MRPLSLLAALLTIAVSASAQRTGGAPEPAAAPAGRDGKDLCGRKLTAEKASEVQALINCLQFCPTPGGAEGCKTGRNGVASTALRRGGAFDERLACKAVLAERPAEIEAVVASVEGVDWAQSKCPQEHGYAASLVFERAKNSETWYRSALTIMQKGSVTGERFAPLLYQSLKAADPKIRALSLSLLRRNFINTADRNERVFPPNEVLVPLMYDADPAVAAQAVTATADRIQQTKAAGAARVDEALSLLGPVTGTNDSFNPLPAGVKPPSPSARKTAIDELGRLMAGSDKPTRHRILRHLMRLPCEEGEIHKSAFELYYKILTPDNQFLRSEKVPGPDGTRITREAQMADGLYQALFGAGDMAGSKNENPNGAKYARNCIGPMRAN